jgi:hypothetical protein
MKKQNISIVVTVRAKTKKEAKEKLVRLMNRTTDYAYVGFNNDSPLWGFHDEYKTEKVKK